MIQFLPRIHLLMMFNGSVTFNKAKAVRHKSSSEAVEALSESYNTLKTEQMKTEQIGNVEADDRCWQEGCLSL